MQSTLHPDRCQTDQDRAISDIAQHRKLIDAYLPGLLRGENVEIHNDGTFSVSGMKAKYILDTYATDRPGQPAMLTVVSTTYSA